MAALLRRKTTQNKSQTHPPTPTYQAACSIVICTCFMLISKAVLHSLHGQFEIYDEYSDCCYGFPASKIYYAYCVGWGFLTSARIAILGWLIPYWGREGCSVHCRMFSIRGPTRYQEHLSLCFLSCDNHTCCRQWQISPSGKIICRGEILVQAMRQGLGYHRTAVWEAPV